MATPGTAAVHLNSHKRDQSTNNCNKYGLEISYKLTSMQQIFFTDTSVCLSAIKTSYPVVRQF